MKSINHGGVLVEEFGITPISAYRSWYVVQEPDGVALHSLHRGHIWQKGTNTAECQRRGIMGRPAHAGFAPDLECSCGFYAARPDQAYTAWDRKKRAHVSAATEIDMWGRIIQCTAGYKAQHVALGDAPLVLEVSCELDCDRPPVAAELRRGKLPTFCEQHHPDYYTVDPVLINLEKWLPEAARQLEARYDVEVVYFGD